MFTFVRQQNMVIFEVCQLSQYDLWQHTTEVISGKFFADDRDHAMFWNANLQSLGPLTTGVQSMRCYK